MGISFRVALFSGMAFLVGGCGGGGQIDGTPTYVLSPDGKSVLFEGAGEGGGDLYDLDLRTMAVRLRVSTGGADYYPTFSQSGKAIAFVSGGEAYRIGISTVAGHHDIIPLQGIKPRSGPTFIGGSSRVAYTEAGRQRDYSFGGKVWDQWDVYSVSVDGSGVERLTSAKYPKIGRPHMVAGSNSLIYAAYTTGGGSIYKLDLASKKVSKLPVSEVAIRSVTTTPDGKTIAYLGNPVVGGAGYQVWRAAIDGTSARQLTRDNISKDEPIISPDGRHVFYLTVVAEGRKYELWQIDIDGKNARRIADSGLFTNPLKWRP